MKTSSLIIVLFISIGSIKAQEKTIKGRVIAEDFDTLVGVSIYVNDTIEVGLTDMEGFYQITIPTSERILIFHFLGLEAAKIELEDSCENVEVTMMYSVSYDFKQPKYVDRKREKRFKKLKEIHSQAFNKGIFKSKCPCYTRQFNSYNE
ncbi:MAG: carboxypeptidase-like regulatory domain-containing protein [Cyclobacteriaceae bacterium]|nr:carboxypeptidase-like regulatory domain-containing protein [Cyclobacteriaceae bacterium]